MTGNEITVTILVDDQPGSYTFENSTKVEEILKHLLPKEEKENWTQYELETEAGKDLDPGGTLPENGVEPGAVLSFNKKEGGGGLR